MPNTQKSVFQKLTTSANTTILTAATATTINVAMLSVCNIHASSSATIEVFVRRSSTDCFDTKGVNVPVTVTYKIQGPIVLEAGDSLIVKASVANVLDVICSYLLTT